MTKEEQLGLAEAQLLGYYHIRAGYEENYNLRAIIEDFAASANATE